MREFINEYKGIIGTIIGTIFGFALSSTKEYFKNRGKIYYDFSDFKLEYEGIDEYGITRYGDNINNLNNIKKFIYNSKVTITNHSNQVKTLKDIKIYFILSDNNELEGIPRIFSHKVAGKFNEFKDLTLLQLNPYETKEIDLSVSIKRDTIINKEIEFNNIYFKAKNIKNKDIKIKII
jgi:hypothetical protein